MVASVNNFCLLWFTSLKCLITTTENVHTWVHLKFFRMHRICQQEWKSIIPKSFESNSPKFLYTVGPWWSPPTIRVRIRLTPFFDLLYAKTRKNKEATVGFFKKVVYHYFQSDAIVWRLWAQRIHPGERQSFRSASQHRSGILQTHSIFLAVSADAQPRVFGHDQSRAPMHPQGAQVHHEPDEASRWGGGDHRRLEVCCHGHRQVLSDHVHGVHRHHHHRCPPLRASHHRRIAVGGPVEKSAQTLINEITEQTLSNWIEPFFCFVNASCYAPTKLIQPIVLPREEKNSLQPTNLYPESNFDCFSKGPQSFRKMKKLLSNLRWSPSSAKLIQSNLRNEEDEKTTKSKLKKYVMTPILWSFRRIYS